MGFTRLYLALCVVAAHSGVLVPWAVQGGTEAVQIFFMISGFYMALIADKYKSKREFYTSRALRIYVPYFAVCIGILICSVGFGLLTDKWLALGCYQTWSTEQNGLIGVIGATLANIFLFGTDWILFFSDEPGAGFQPTVDFHQDANPLARYLLIQPAWSIGAELTFYLLVPFLNKLSTKLLGLVVITSLVARIATYELLGQSFDPWTYRFFPFELALFGLGMLAHRLYLSFSVKKLTEDGNGIGKISSIFNSYAVQIVAILVVFWILFSATQWVDPWIPIHYGRLIEYGCLALALPVLFQMTKNNKVDRFVGELSYPIYLTHYFVVSLVAALFTRTSIFAEWQRGPMVAIISIVASIALFLFICQPFERRRRAMAKKLSGNASPTDNSTAPQ